MTPTGSGYGLGVDRFLLARRLIRAPREVLEPSGSVAQDIDGMWRFLLALGTAVFCLFGVLLVAGIRRRAGDGPHEDHDRSARRWIVGGGVVMPAVVIGVVIAATVMALADPPLDADGEDRLVIEVTGHQWWWEVTYPDRGVETANEIHLPAGEAVELRLRAADVVHSFWVPALAGKMDLLPERTNTLVLDAQEPGRYAARCAEFCGLQHARMELTVVAHEPAAFERWVDEQTEPAGAATESRFDRARELFDAGDCARCHTVDGTGADGDRGPDLSHVASRERIAAGSLPNDTVALTEWIRDPHAAKTGVDMPMAPLDDAEIDRIVEYLEALR